MLFSTLCLASAVLLADAPAVATPTVEDRQIYESAAKLAGRDPDAQARLAIWCEAHGMMTERARHLALAVLADPDHRVARGLLGQIEDNGKWRRPDQVAESIKANEPLAKALAEYRVKRDQTPATADAHWKLALWCEANGLEAQAQSHLTTVIRIDPSRSEAWKRLGYKKRDGRWRTDAQVAAIKAETAAQAKADKTWKKSFELWKGWLARDEKRDEALAALAGVEDPRAVPSVLAVFGASDPRMALQLLGQIDSRNASRALAALAVFGSTDEVRQTATATLRRRDPREYADLLIGLVRDPIQYEVKPVGGPGSPGRVYIVGEKADYVRRYAAPTAPGPMPGDRLVGYDELGLPLMARMVSRNQTPFIPTAFLNSGGSVGGLPSSTFDPQTAAALRGLQGQLTQNGSRMDLEQELGAPMNASALGEVGRTMRLLAATPIGRDPSLNVGFSTENYSIIPVGRQQAEAVKAALSAQEQLQSDLAALGRYNQFAREINERVLPVLNQAAGGEIQGGRNAWTAWWINQLGYPQPQRTEERSVLMVDVPPAYVPQPVVPIQTITSTNIVLIRHSCFGAGTLVQTRLGAEPIETLKVGDEVLTQDAESGRLRYQPIVMVHHNPPSETLRVEFTNGSVVASTFHRFWIAGHGWKMARELESGDMVRGLNGTERVVKIEPDTVQPVFNLDVAGDHSFFVGKQPVLVRDNTVPGTRLTPFDAVAALK